MPGANWHLDIVQGTPEWHALRLGKVTASMLSDILSSGRGGSPSVGRANALAEIVAQRLTGEATKSFKSASMQRGNDLEPLARIAYEELTQDFVEQVGFVDHPSVKWYGASPDGFRGDIGLEIKCPEPKQHLATLQGQPIKKDYIDQMDAQMDCCDFLGVDFVSYCPEFPGKMKLIVIHHARNEPEIRAKREAVKQFLAEVEDTMETLRRKYRE